MLYGPPHSSSYQAASEFTGQRYPLFISWHFLVYPNPGLNRFKRSIVFIYAYEISMGQTFQVANPVFFDIRSLRSLLCSVALARLNSDAQGRLPGAQSNGPLCLPQKTPQDKLAPPKLPE